MIRSSFDYVILGDSQNRGPSPNYANWRKRLTDYCAARGYQHTAKGHTADGAYAQNAHSSVSSQTISGCNTLVNARLGTGGTIAGAGNIKLIFNNVGAGNVVGGSPEPYVPGDTVPNLLLPHYLNILDREPSAILVGSDIADQQVAHANTLLFNAEFRTMIPQLRAARPGRKIRFWSMYDAVGLYDVGNYQPGDGLHITDTVSYGVVGDAMLAAIAADLNDLAWYSGDASGTGTLTASARSKLLDHTRNVAAYTPAATHYVHLYAAGGVALTSGNAPGYAAYSHANDTTLWPNAVGRLKYNGLELTFGTPTGTWLDVVEVRVTDNATPGAGTVLLTETFAGVPVSTGTGPFTIPAGALSLAASPTDGVGGWSDLQWQRAINLMFGGVANTPLTTVYGSWWDGEPAYGGAQLGSRVAITQASSWGAAASGLAQTSAPIALAHQSGGLWWVEHDASSGGNLLYHAPRPTGTGATGSIPTGKLRVALS